jgi:hypothetical protein
MCGGDCVAVRFRSIAKTVEHDQQTGAARRVWHEVALKKRAAF